MAEQHTMTYVGRAACGCVQGLRVDTPDKPREVAKDVGKFIRSGLTVDRIATETVRCMAWYCEAHTPMKQTTIEEPPS